MQKVGPQMDFKTYVKVAKNCFKLAEKCLNLHYSQIIGWKATIPSKKD